MKKRRLKKRNNSDDGSVSCEDKSWFEVNNKAANSIDKNCEEDNSKRFKGQDLNTKES